MNKVKFAPELLAIGLAALLVGSLFSNQSCMGGCGAWAGAKTSTPAPAPAPAFSSFDPEWIKDMRGRD
jgi:hypothetical protein